MIPLPQQQLLDSSSSSALMQQSPVLSVLFALLAFSLIAFAAPSAGKELLAVRNDTGLTAILNLCLDLQVKINLCIAALGEHKSGSRTRAR